MQLFQLCQLLFFICLQFYTDVIEELKYVKSILISCSTLKWYNPCKHIKIYLHFLLVVQVWQCTGAQWVLMCAYVWLIKSIQYKHMFYVTYIWIYWDTNTCVYNNLDYLLKLQLMNVGLTHMYILVIVALKYLCISIACRWWNDNIKKLTCISRWRNEFTSGPNCDGGTVLLLPPHAEGGTEQPCVPQPKSPGPHPETAGHGLGGRC